MMQTRSLGSSGLEASVIILGTWATGGWMWGGSEEQTAIRAIDASLDHGVNALDTAPVYGMGRSEEIVGKALKGKRDKVIIATKCGLVWHTQKGEHFFNTDEDGPRDDATMPVFKYLAPESIRYEVEQSLRRLQTDYIDVYQTHWQESTTAIADTMGELMKLKQEGKIRAIGVCNATPEQMDEYRNAGVLDTDQEKYSMLDRKPDTANLPYVQKHGMAFFAYSPLVLGLLSGRITADRVYGKGDLRASKPRFQAESIAKVQALLKEIEPIANDHHCTLSQLVLAWTFHQPGCSHLLVGARQPEHAIENAKAGALRLKADEVETITQAVARHSADIPA